MYLLDTNICIYFMKNTYPELTQRLLSHDPSELLISLLTVLSLTGIVSRYIINLDYGIFGETPGDARFAYYQSHVRCLFYCLHSVVQIGRKE